MLAIAQLINDGYSYESNSRDFDLALRSYKIAYNNIVDINSQININNINSIAVPGVCPYEIRSVGDYLNYRACMIQFQMDHPREAITQFRKHIETFKQHTKAPEYAFEHAAWLSQQYLLFADLFSQAVARGLKASKNQQPGQYYYEAAMQMMIRRDNTTEFTNDIIRSQQMPVTSEFLAQIHAPMFVSFLRQCGWTCVDSQATTYESTSNAQDRVINQSEPINYSESIIRSLLKASEGFREWSRPRMRNFINVMIANEYKLCGDLTNAKMVYEDCLVLYEKEKWWPLVSNVEDKRDESAMSKQLQDLVTEDNSQQDKTN